jgi:putative glycosyltransferase
MKLSIVTTLYKSAPYIKEFHRRIMQEALKITADYEIIMVDDGSPDNSLEVALNILQNDSHLRIIELSRNFGHHKAMMTGLEHASGDLIFLIDVDLEEPPELLSKFYRTLINGGWDVVFGFQEQHRKGSLFEKYGGRLAWWIFDLMLPVKIPHNHCTVRLMTRNYTQALIRHKEHKTAIGGLWVITGFKQTGIPFVKGYRGTSSYGVGTRLFMLLDSITSFSELPLLGIFFLGLGILLISGIFGMYLIFRRLTGIVLAGWVSVMVSLWFLVGLAIFCIGVVGLYVSRIFIETKMRPYTIIRRIYNQ